MVTVFAHFKGGGPLDGGMQPLLDAKDKMVRVPFNVRDLNGRLSSPFCDLYSLVGPVPVDKLESSERRDGNRHVWFTYCGPVVNKEGPP